VAQVIGFIKGKAAIYVAPNFEGRANVRGHSFWARGYFASTVGRDDDLVRSYIREQEHEDRRLDQLDLDLT